MAVVALLVGKNVRVVEVDNTITAAEGAVSKTVEGFDAVVALFVGINNPIATSG